MKTMLKTLVIGWACLLASCTKDDASPAITAEEASVNAKIDLANNDVTDIVMNEEQSTYLDPANKNSAVSALALPPLGTVSRITRKSSTKCWRTHSDVPSVEPSSMTMTSKFG